MESTEDLQKLELTALKSIFAEDFIETPPPKAWKAAARLPEFEIKVHHPASSKVCFNLNVKFPKTYPSVVPPTFAVQKPANGLSNEQLVQLNQAIHAEAHAKRGSEMVFEIVTFSADWLSENVRPPVETVGSLALQMNLRAVDEAKAKQQKAEEEERRENELAAQRQREFEEQFEAAKRAKELEEQYEAEAYMAFANGGRRKRANSETTEVPAAGDIPTETFTPEIEFNGIVFDTVKYFHGREHCLGVLYAAEPLTEFPDAPKMPLELYVVTFASRYYSTSQGRKKLTQLETEIQRLAAIRHPNVLSVLAVKLIKPLSVEAPKLMILSEQPPALTLQDVLEDSDCLREERASDYLAQLLTGLAAIHAKDIVHRNINPRAIGLAPRQQSNHAKLLKIFKVSYHTRLLDLHKSDSFSNKVIPNDSQLPEAWLSNDVKYESSLLYTRQRDIHDVGIVLLQMLLGLDCVKRFSDLDSALYASTISQQMQTLMTNMLLPPKRKTTSCQSILAELAKPSPVIIPSRSPIIPVLADPRTPMQPNAAYSPESDYFKTPLVSSRNSRPQVTSRWKEDWEELELLGKGAFGSVVKARNKVDNQIYAVKKVKLKMHSDAKIFREVNAISRLSHRFIVRYYTTWLETAEPDSAAPSESGDSDSEAEMDQTSVPHSSSGKTASSDNLRLYDDLDDLANLSTSKGSFPSIHFSHSEPGSEEDEAEEEEDDEDDDDDDEDGVGGGFFMRQQRSITPAPPQVQRTLYIQMEFVERQTMKEQVNDGLTEAMAWKQFKQIVEALVHMASLRILHRDIKLTNIFIDGEGDVKVGDFGLATSSLAEVDPSDVAPSVSESLLRSDMTLDVGTRLYIAPEVQSRIRGPTDHTKADMYSLGIVFFEMNFPFSTGAERIAVIENLRKPQVIFPPTWDPLRARQREIITWLLDHDPSKRPTALELSQSSLLPQDLEDDYFRKALEMMVQKDSPHHEAMLSALFTQPQNSLRGFLYDSEIVDSPEFESLTGIVVERLAAVFRLHGAIDMEPSLLMPKFNFEELKNHAMFIDRYGDLVTLPNNLIALFARLAARAGHNRIKRYHIKDIFRPNHVAGHPKGQKAAVFDIISPDIQAGGIAAAAELVAVANRILESFPNLAENYDIHMSHSSVVQLILDRIPPERRAAVLEITYSTKYAPQQRRQAYFKQTLLKGLIDELEILADFDDIENTMYRLDKISSSLGPQMRTYVEEMKLTIQYASSAGVNRPVFFHPLMVGSHNDHFKDGILVEVARKTRRLDILAAGGRYDNLINTYTAPLASTPKSDPICAYGIQISVEKIKAALAAYQTSSLKSLVKEKHSFGFWSRKRCDVYIVSHQSGGLQERLEIAAYLWKHNISADLMYEAGLQHAENYVDICASEGILFILYPRLRSGGRRDQTAFKVKSILKGDETDVTRQDLIPWLRQEISEQRRIDITTAQVPIFSDAPVAPYSTKFPISVVQPVLPVTDTKKQRKQVKNIFEDRAFETAEEIRKIFVKPEGMPTIVVDVPAAVFDMMIKSSTWLTDEEHWKTMWNLFPPHHTATSYPQQIKDAVLKRKTDGYKFVLLYGVRQERMQLLQL
ncbi:kinase-like domain-containing protein [Mycena floridula]|nr:kinase-like domain-containing protein [Mycena floridula]